MQSPIFRNVCCSQSVDFIEVERAVYAETYRHGGFVMESGKDGCSCGFLVRVTARGQKRVRVDRSVVIQCDGCSGFCVGTDDLHYYRNGRLPEINTTTDLLDTDFRDAMTGENLKVLLNRWMRLIGR